MECLSEMSCTYLHGNYDAIRPLDGQLLRQTLNWILQADKKKGSIELLEPGCGSGRVLNILKEVNGILLFGLDKDEVLINEAKERFRDNHHVKVEKGDFLEYAFGGRKFDYIIFSQYFHHLKQGEVIRHVNKANDLLKTNGRLLFLFEDSPYYSFLLGYAPSTAHGHPLTDLHTQYGPTFKSIRSSYGPYLPHEIVDLTEKQFYMAPVFWYSTNPKDVNWIKECEMKRASIFSKLNKEQLNTLNKSSLEFKIPVQPYLFYSSSNGPIKNNLPKRSSRRKSFDASKAGHTNASVSDWLQSVFQELTLDHSAAFLSVYPRNYTATSTNRDLYLGGALPKAELAFWFDETYNSKLKKFKNAELSPSFLVSHAKDQGQYVSNVDIPGIDFEEKETLKKSLMSFYKKYGVFGNVRSEFDEYCELLWSSLSELEKLFRFTDESPNKFWYKRVPAGHHEEKGYPSVLIFKRITWFNLVETAAAEFARITETIDKQAKKDFPTIKRKSESDRSTGQQWFKKGAGGHPLVAHSLDENKDTGKTKKFLEDNGLRIPTYFNQHFYEGLNCLFDSNTSKRFASIYAILLIAAKVKDVAVGDIDEVTCSEETNYPILSDIALECLYNFFEDIVKTKDGKAENIRTCTCNATGFLISFKETMAPEKILENALSKLQQGTVEGTKGSAGGSMAKFLKVSGWRLVYGSQWTPPICLYQGSSTGDLTIFRNEHSAEIRFSRTAAS